MYKLYKQHYPQIIHHYFFVSDCGPPPVVVNATAALNSATLLGSTATYSCDVGLGINGSEVISCTSSGWDEEPQCVTGDNCLHEPCSLYLILFVFSCSVLCFPPTLFRQYYCFTVHRRHYFTIVKET